MKLNARRIAEIVISKAVLAVISLFFHIDAIIDKLRGNVTHYEKGDVSHRIIYYSYDKYDHEGFNRDFSFPTEPDEDSLPPTKPDRDFFLLTNLINDLSRSKRIQIYEEKPEKCAPSRKVKIITNNINVRFIGYRPIAYRPRKRTTPPEGGFYMIIKRYAYAYY